MIGQINVNNYRVPLGNGNAAHNVWQQHITEALNSLWPNAADIREVDVYNMTGKLERFDAGVKNRRLVILGNCGHLDAELDGVTYLPHRPNTLHFKNENDEVMAEFDEEKFEFYFLFDVFKDENFEVFDKIMKEMDERYFFPKTLENSWLHTRDKDKLTEALAEALRNQRVSFIAEEKSRIDSLKNQVNDFRQRIKTNLDSIKRSSLRVIQEEEQVASVGKALLHDLDLIAQHEKVKDLHIKDNKFVVYTNPLYMYTSKDERFYLGNMRIELSPEIADVRFFGDNPRKSYWTRSDPHPHVNGRNGEACLGNASTLIADLSHQMQLYPLMLTALDFLEQANLEDVAGRNVYNWDKVDDAGNIINTGGSTVLYCSRCEDDVDELFTVYESIDDDGPTDARQVCDDCRVNHYRWDEDAEVYVED